MRARNILTYLLCPALLLSASSCALEDTRDYNRGGEIAIRAFTGSMTRAEPIEDMSTYGNAVHIYAYRTSGTGTFTQYFHDNFSKQSDGLWSTNPPYYWPKDGSLIFFGYNVYAANKLSATVNATDNIKDNAGFTLTGIEVPRQAADQVDLIVGRSGKSDQNQGHTEAEASTTGVPLNLVHAMAQVKITAKCHKPTMRVEVAGVKIVNLHNTATLGMPLFATNQNNGGNSGGISFGRWSAKSGYNTGTEFVAIQDNVAQNASPTATLNTTEYKSLMPSKAGSFMLIPQKASENIVKWNGGAANEGTYIAVLCRISQATTSTGSPSYVQLFPKGADNKGKYAWTAVPFVPDWDPGHTYTYQLDFFEGSTGGGGIVPPTDTEPDKPEIVDPGINPGEEIVGGPISFTVEMNGWDQNTNIQK